MPPPRTVCRRMAACCLLLLALAAPTGAAAGPWPLRLEYRQPRPAGEQTPIALTLTIEAERTVMDRDGLKLSIDYGRRELIRQEAGREDRVVYPLAPPGGRPAAPATPGEALRVQAAAYRIVATRPGQRVRAWPAREVQVWFGPGLSRLRTMVPLAVTAFGEQFGERRVRYWVSAAVTDHDALRQLAAGRRPLVRANPLLLQLDPVNLILPLGALPVRLEEPSDGGVRVLELQPR